MHETELFAVRSEIDSVTLHVEYDRSKGPDYCRLRLVAISRKRSAPMWVIGYELDGFSPDNSQNVIMMMMVTAMEDRPRDKAAASLLVSRRLKRLGLPPL